MAAQGVARVLLFAAFVLQARGLERAPVTCLFRRVTGYPCPSCGLTRSWQAVAHLQFADGVGYHPMGPLTVLGAMWLAVDEGAERRLANADRRVSALLGAAWLATWLGRVLRHRTRGSVAT